VCEIKKEGIAEQVGWRRGGKGTEGTKKVEAYEADPRL